MNYVIDSNILIYYLNKLLTSEGRQFVLQAIREGAHISIITRIEILGRPRGTPSVQQPAIDLLNQFTEQPLTEEIVQKCIEIRQQHRIKLPDAIIAATALHLQLPLVTRNTDDFKNIDSLALINPFDSPA